MCGAVDKEGAVDNGRATNEAGAVMSHRGAYQRPVIAAVAIVAVTATALRLMGQPWWCSRGDLVPWALDINTAHNSQHLFDPYTLTHILHGLVFYAVLAALGGKHFDHSRRFVVAIAVEAAWEIFENTDLIIGRYREATISLDYFGDSILNSLADITACALGYGLAAFLPAWGSVALFAAVELFLLLWIRDSLLLNVVMLAWPIEVIRDWQSAG